MTKNIISFETEEPLLSLLDGDVDHFSVTEDVHGNCNELTLWFSDEHGVNIYTKMHNVAFRLEVGVLTLKRVSNKHKTSSVNHPLLRTPESIRFSSPQPLLDVWKLTISEGDFTCESGLKIVFEENKELIVLPSSFPCHLYVLAKFLSLERDSPEYDVHTYEQVKLS